MVEKIKLNIYYAFLMLVGVWLLIEHPCWFCAVFLVFLFLPKVNSNKCDAIDNAQSENDIEKKTGNSYNEVTYVYPYS